MTRIYSWERVYRVALEETDPNKIPSAVMAAQEVVLDRVRELEKRATRSSINELAWLEKAVDRLAAIRLTQSTAEASGSDTPSDEVPLARAKSTGV
jgi:hypothetical protein